MNEQASAVKDLAATLHPLERWYLIFSAVIGLIVWVMGAFPVALWPMPLREAVSWWLTVTLVLPVAITVWSAVAAIFSYFTRPKVEETQRTTPKADLPTAGGHAPGELPPGVPHAIPGGRSSADRVTPA